MSKYTIRLVGFSVFGLFMILILAVIAIAQAGNYKPGDKIDYLDYGKWETGGTYVGATPGNSQPIIRKKPNEFYPEGSQTAWDWEKIRPTAAAKPKPWPPALTRRIPAA